MRYEHARPSLSPRTRTFRALPTAATSVSGQTHTSRHRLPGCALSVTKLPREASKHPSANRADVLLSLLRTRACRTGERLGERRGGRRVAPLSPGMALGARDFRGAGADSYGGGVLRAEEAAGRARDGRRVRRGQVRRATV